MKKAFLIAMFCVLLFSLVGCQNATTVELKEKVSIENETVVADTKTKKFQDKHSMDWDFIDAEFLLKIAEYKGGTVEDRAYTILVTLNRVWEYALDDTYEPYSEYTVSMIQDVVLRELYEVEGITPTEFEGIIPGEETKEAMNMIMHEKFDNSNGSLEYIN